MRMGFLTSLGGRPCLVGPSLSRRDNNSSFEHRREAKTAVRLTQLASYPAIISCTSINSKSKSLESDPIASTDQSWNGNRQPSTHPSPTVTPTSSKPAPQT